MVLFSNFFPIRTEPIHLTSELKKKGRETFLKCKEQNKRRDSTTEVALSITCKCQVLNRLNTVSLTLQNVCSLCQTII